MCFSIMFHLAYDIMYSYEPIMYSFELVMYQLVMVMKLCQGHVFFFYFFAKTAKWHSCSYLPL